MSDIRIESLDEALYTLVELCTSSQLEEGFIISCIEHGVVEVSGSSVRHWRFTNRARLQLQKAWRLHRDLEVQPSALPLVMELLGELESLRLENERLRRRLRQWEDLL